MKWTIPQLQRYRDKEFNIDETVDLSELKEIDPEIRDVLPFRVFGRADIGSNRITFHLNISGTLVLPCSRTLVDVNFPVQVFTTETFLFEAPGNMELGEGEFHVTDGDVIDLMPVLKEIVLLEIPLQVFTDQTNPENGAPQSGKDWEVITEEEQSKKVDPRLAKLAELFNSESNDEK